MKSVKRIFSKELTRSQQIQSWQLLGPLSLIFTSSLLHLNGAVNTDLLLCMLFGSLLIWKEPKRGWIFAAGLLSISVLLKHLYISEGHVWQLGVESCVGLGYLLTHLSLREVRDDVLELESEKQEQVDQALNLEEMFLEKKRQLDSEKGLLEDRIDLLKKELFEKGEKVRSLENLTDVLRQTLREKEQKTDTVQDHSTHKDQVIAKLQFEVVDLKEELKALEDVSKIRASNQQLLKDLNQHRVDAYQSKLISDMLREMLKKVKKQANNYETEEKLLQSQRIIESLEEKLNQKPEGTDSEKYESLRSEYEANLSLVKKYEDRFKKLRPSETALKQLRKQFEEKNDVLHQARVELFQVENELLAMKRDREEIVYKGAHDLTDVVADFQALFDAYETLEEENTELSKIISHLMGDDLKDSLDDHLSI